MPRPTLEDALAFATTPGRMDGVLTRHAPPGVAVRGCRVARYRFRPGHRCLVQLVVSTEAAPGAVSEQRVTAQWLGDANRASDLFRRLSARAAALPSWRGPFPPVFFDPELQMLATTFPFDRRLPGLALVAANQPPELVAPMLAAMGAAWSDVEACDVQPVRYREQLSAVCRYTVRASRSVSGPLVSRCFVKFYADDDGARVAATLAALSGASERTSTIRVDSPVAYVPTARALILPEAPGRALDALLDECRERAAIGPALAQAAAALAAFASLDAGEAPLRAGRDGVQAFARAAAAVRAADGDAGRRLATIARAAAADAVPADARGLVHGDVKLEHLLLDGDVVHFIDLDSAHHGDCRWDIALFGARWWAAADARPDTAPLAAWGCSLADRVYRRCAPRDWHRTSAAPRALALVDVAAGVVKRQEPGWRLRLPRLLDEAVRVVEAAR